MKQIQWYELGVTEGEDGTRTIDRDTNLRDLQRRAQKTELPTYATDMFIDKWYMKDGSPKPDDTFKTILVKHQKMRNQLDIMRDIQEAGYNIVTCGECGAVMLHDSYQTVLTCPYCEHTSECCDFPDLFYENWENDIMRKKKQEANSGV